MNWLAIENNFFWIIVALVVAIFLGYKLAKNYDFFLSPLEKFVSSPFDLALSRWVFGLSSIFLIGWFLVFVVLATDERKDFVVSSVQCDSRLSNPECQERLFNTLVLSKTYSAYSGLGISDLENRARSELYVCDKDKYAPLDEVANCKLDSLEYMIPLIVRRIGIGKSLKDEFLACKDNLACERLTHKKGEALNLELMTLFANSKNNYHTKNFLDEFETANGLNFVGACIRDLPATVCQSEKLMRRENRAYKLKIELEYATNRNSLFVNLSNSLDSKISACKEDFECLRLAYEDAILKYQVSLAEFKNKN